MAASGAALAAAAWRGRTVAKTLRGEKALVFGHRGAPAHRPEHTRGSYLRAIEDGADYIEPDLVATRDGVLVVRHENNIADTTDVSGHPEFAGRKATKSVDGQSVTGWFTEDFTLAELKTLRAIERLGDARPESKGHDGQYDVLTFVEAIDLVAGEAAKRGRLIGLVPEIKHSTYFARIGLPLEDRFLAVLAAHDYAQRAPIEIQSFEIANLKYLRERVGRPSNVRLMQLFDAFQMTPADVAASGGSLSYADMATPGGLATVAAKLGLLLSEFNRPRHFVRVDVQQTRLRIEGAATPFCTAIHAG